jgi:hypothetical protein
MLRCFRRDAKGIFRLERRRDLLFFFFLSLCASLKLSREIR